MNELIQKVISWSKEKGIKEKSTTLTQLKKVQEELSEFRDEIALTELILTHDRIFQKKAKERQKMEAGDLLLSAIVAIDLEGFDPVECLSMAYDKVSSRKGRMINGTFVKEENLPENQ